MLFDIDKNKIDWIPHHAEYDTWTNRLTKDEFKAIKNELNNRVSEADVHTSSWMPGRDWERHGFSADLRPGVWPT